jgi:hypothetical protein
MLFPISLGLVQSIELVDVTQDVRLRNKELVGKLVVIVKHALMQNCEQSAENIRFDSTLQRF